MKTLIQQTLDKKIELTQRLRLLLKSYIPWVNGETLVQLTQAIASLEQEIDGEIVTPRPIEPELDQILQRLREIRPCPMGHPCGSYPCAHFPVCSEVSSNASN